jgi:uncharacterized membrane protein YdjX (TVP38/TMEM64 family)
VSKKVSDINILATVVGIIPGSIAYAYACQQLCCIDSHKDIISINMLITFIPFGLVALLRGNLKKKKQLQYSFWINYSGENRHKQY